ncbi:Methyltransferase domain protein [Prochlorococcus marinus str. MIT 1320]|nr:Methyltransferase domain protein [Prochlorococcus marinus str. MIT 1320]
MSEDFWETQVYSKSKHFNRYPFDRVVSVVMSSLNQLPQPLTALDLGSGTGNHLKFLCENNFSCIGIEHSISAVSLSRSYLLEHGHSPEIIVGDITQLDNFLGDNRFSFILDRGSLTHNPLLKVESALSQISSRLITGGIFLSYIFSVSHSSTHGAIEIEPSFYSGYSLGDFAGCPAPALFLTQSSILDLFSPFFTIQKLSEISTNHYLPSPHISAMFEIVCTSK